MKRPNLKKFENVAGICNGNITSIAKAFNVNRTTVYNWTKEDQEFKEVIENFKGVFLDECLTVARAVALGVPERDEAGKFIGWKERPNFHMLRYFISTLGRNEGYGENIDITTNGEPINQITIFELPSNGRD